MHLDSSVMHIIRPIPKNSSCVYESVVLGCQASPDYLSLICLKNLFFLLSLTLLRRTNNLYLFNTPPLISFSLNSM
jgi:hypothetical protein